MSYYQQMISIPTFIWLCIQGQIKQVSRKKKELLDTKARLKLE